MAKVSEFLNGLFTQAGIESDNEELKLFLADEKLQDMEVSDDLTKKVNNSLMTLESAKNNKDVNDSFMAKFYGSIDASTKRTLKDAGLPEDRLAEIDKVTDTPKKIELALKEMADFAKGQVPASDGGDEELKKKNKELSDQVNTLTTKVNEFPSVLEKREGELNKEFETKETSYKLGSIVSQYKFVPDTDLDFINFKVNKELETSDYVINSTMNLMQKSNPELIAQKDNKNFTLKDFLDEKLSSHLLKSNGSNGSSNGDSVHHQVAPPDKPLKNNQTGAHIQEKTGLQFSDTNRPKTVKMSPPPSA